jgi:SAM-dependent methyltransferase
MNIPACGKILEIGSGPGWITEILVMLGFSVEALEPSADMIEIAQSRISGLAKHYGRGEASRVHFHEATIEDIAFDAECFDGVLFFDALHHVVDEISVIDKCFQMLKSGGCIGIVESAWHPEFVDLEHQLLTEMMRFGTMENPFSTKYLDLLLSNAGFVGLQRLVSVNGFFSRETLSRPLSDFAIGNMASSNNVIARKPLHETLMYPSCSDSTAKTYASLRVVSGGIDAQSRRASLTIEVHNSGETFFDSNPHATGRITIALRNGQPGCEGFLEGVERHALGEAMPPGKTIQMQVVFSLPPGASLDGWVVDAVAEGLFWFSTVGVPSCPIECIR